MGNKQPKQKQQENDNYPPINFKKIKKSGLRIGAHIDIGMKDFETGMTFGKNYVSEMYYSEDNQHLKLFENMKKEEQEKQKDEIISTLLKEKNEKI